MDPEIAARLDTLTEAIQRLEARETAEGSSARRWWSVGGTLALNLAMAGFVVSILLRLLDTVSIVSVVASACVAYSAWGRRHPTK